MSFNLTAYSSVYWTTEPGHIRAISRGLRVDVTPRHTGASRANDHGVWLENFGSDSRSDDASAGAPCTFTCYRYHVARDRVSGIDEERGARWRAHAAGGMGQMGAHAASCSCRPRIGVNTTARRCAYPTCMTRYLIRSVSAPRPGITSSKTPRPPTVPLGGGSPRPTPTAAAGSAAMQPTLIPSLSVYMSSGSEAQPAASAGAGADQGSEVPTGLMESPSGPRLVPTVNGTLLVRSYPAY
jgi:hypothetical protein